jgi:hypothetical protein
MTPAPEEVFTMAPRPCWSIRGISYFMQRKTPRTLMAMIRSHSSSVMSAADLGLLFDAGVVEGDIGASERCDRLVQRGLDVRGLGYVALDGERLAAEVLDHAGCFLVAVVGHVGDHDAGALAGERQGRSAADPAGRAGHERDLGLRHRVRNSTIRPGMASTWSARSATTSTSASAPW